MSGITLKVYNLFWRLAKTSEDGTVSITNARIAKMVNARNEGKRTNYIIRVKATLVKEGWLEFLGLRKGKEGTWLGGRYRPISHEDWAGRKSAELGTSPCHPQAMVVSPSKFCPGGRAYQGVKNKNSPRLEVSTAENAEVCTATPHRAHLEVSTVLHPGSVRTVHTRKYAQSVDLSTGVLRTRRKEQMIAASPPARPSALLSSLDLPVEEKNEETPNPKPEVMMTVSYEPLSEAEIEQRRQKQKLDLELHLKLNPHLKSTPLRKEPETISIQEARELRIAW